MTAMRNIKFRALDAVSGKGWVYGDLVHNQKVTLDGLEPRFMVGGYEVTEESIGQFTGLKDMNGVEIYEGDIVIRHDLTFNIRKVCVVFYDNMTAAFKLSFKNDIYASFYDFAPNVSYYDGKSCVVCSLKYEIIGNIYENKELLTSK